LTINPSKVLQQRPNEIESSSPLGQNLCWMRTGLYLDQCRHQWA